MTFTQRLDKSGQIIVAHNNQDIGTICPLGNQFGFQVENGYTLCEKELQVVLSILVSLREFEHNEKEKRL